MAEHVCPTDHDGISSWMYANGVRTWVAGGLDYAYLAQVRHLHGQCPTDPDPRAEAPTTQGGLERAESAVARVEALADEWDDGETPWDAGKAEARDIRAALAEPEASEGER